jgi:predicted lipoprotein with Yx(FWY)xxD motif
MSGAATNGMKPFARGARTEGMRTLTFFLLAVALVTASASAASPRAKVLVHVTSVGGVLADARGHTLYSYADDHGRTPSCYASCASLWPPFLTAAKPIAGTGAKLKLLGTTTRKDGKLQVTYAGHPLYFFSGDAKAGQVKGQGYEGSWWALAASGAKVKTTATTSTSPPPPTTTTVPDYPPGNGGY